MYQKFMPLVFILLLVPVLLASGCTGLFGPEGTAETFMKKIINGEHDDAINNMMVNEQGEEFVLAEGAGAKLKMTAIKGAVDLLGIDPKELVVQGEPNKTIDLGDGRKRVFVAVGLNLKQENSRDIFDDISNLGRKLVEENIRYVAHFDMIQVNSQWKVYWINR